MELKQYFTNKMQNVVARFQKTFGHPLETKPTLPTLGRFVNRKGWGTVEEMVEQLHTLSNNQEEFESAIESIRMYLDKAVVKQAGKEFILDPEEKKAHLADGLVDELWFLLGDFCEAGIDAEPVLNIVDDSNMSKLFTNEETGERYAKADENGKIMKSPEFFAPEERIAEEIKRQSA